MKCKQDGYGIVRDILASSPFNLGSVSLSQELQA